MKATIVHLPGGRWRLDVGNCKSETADYSQRIVAIFGDKLYTACTQYFGIEMVIVADNPKEVGHESVDKSLGE